MSIKSQPLWAAFVGGLINGHQVIAIDVKAEIDKLFYTNERRRVHTQCIELADPAETVSGHEADRGGKIVVFIGGVTGGELFGPFADGDIAESFASEVIDQRELVEASFELFEVASS